MGSLMEVYRNPDYLVKKRSSESAFVYKNAGSDGTDPAL